MSPERGARTRQGNRAGRAAVIELKSAPLSGEFGMTMLRAKFPELADEILRRLGTITRGPRKGMQRGVITWEKVVEGGFDYRRDARCVVYPGTQKWDVVPDSYAADASVIGAIMADRERSEESVRRMWESVAPQCVLLVERSTRLHRSAMSCLRDGDMYDFRRLIAKARANIRDARATGTQP